MNTTTRLVLTASVLSLAAGCAAEDTRIKTLLVTGHNNHNWQYTSRVHADTLEATGKFKVDITETPASTLADPKKVAEYKLIVLDYNDSHQAKRWGQPAEAVFADAVRNGTGLVSIHSANNAFDGWADYEKMIGLMWREGTGHGKFHEFEVAIVEPGHPIMQGLPAANPTIDELYHNLINTQKAPFKLLAQAMSSKESGGTGKNEPMALTLEFGKGRVFHTPLGHTWTGDERSKASVCTPFFRSLLVRGAEWAATGSVTSGPSWADVRQHNTLTDQEKADGWELLFDGTKPPALRGFKKDHLPARWKVENGTITLAKGDGEGGDIVTLGEYSDFEFAVDWRVEKGGNSGIMYHSTEDHNYPWETGPEMQILDNANHNDGKKAKTSAGALYDVKECAFDVARPAGEWNSARVVCKGTRVEHWLNGKLVVEVDTASEDYKQRFKQSKFTGMPDYNTRPKGHIALQDHGDIVSFRNIKVLDLTKKK